MLHEETKAPRERRHDANQRRIVATAMRMVEEGGLDALSMNKLAEAVDYTPGALYRYFASKDALLAELVRACLEDVRRSLTTAEQALPERASPFARVFVLVRAYRAFARLRPERFALLSSTMTHPKVLLPRAADAEPVMAVMVASLEPLSRALSDAAAAGLVAEGDVPERVLCTFALLQGVLQLQKQARLAPALLDVDRLATRGVRTLLVGWGAKPKTVESAIERALAVDDLDRRLGESR